MKNNLTVLGLALWMLPMYLQAGTGQDLKPTYQPAQGKNTRSAEPIPAGTILPISLNSALRSDKSDTRVLIEGTFGIRFKPYDGSREKVNRGRIQWGPQFSYVDRNTWSGSGIDFTGFIIKPGRTYLRQTSLSGCKRKIRAWERKGSPVDQETLEKVSQSLNSYLGMLRQVNGYKARKALCCRVESLFLQADGHCTKVKVVKVIRMSL